MLPQDGSSGTSSRAPGAPSPWGAGTEVAKRLGSTPAASPSTHVLMVAAGLLARPQGTDAPRRCTSAMHLGVEWWATPCAEYRSGTRTEHSLTKSSSSSKPKPIREVREG